MKTRLILLFVALNLNLSAQNCEPKNSLQLGFTFSYFPVTNIFSLTDGDIQLHGKQFYAFGFSGICSIGNKFSIESGLALSKYSIELIPIGPDATGKINKDATLVSIPVIFRYSFLKYAFICAGPSFDFSLRQPQYLEDQTGIGLTVGPGIQYEVGNRIAIMVNPYLSVHSLISYETGPGNGHIIEGSVRLGLYYRL